MQEGNPVPTRTAARFFIEKYKPLTFQPLQLSSDVIHLEREMMNTFAALLDKFRYR